MADCAKAGVTRAFLDLPHGQIHLRSARPSGAVSGLPVVMLHQSPGSSKQLERHVAAFAAAGRVTFAPDTPGNGDSDPLPNEVPTIADLAAVQFDAIRQLIPEGRFDLYGSHTGASIAMEIAIAHPDRVASLTIDGMGLYSPELQADMLQRYAREIAPDDEATHLMKVWHFCRDQFLFWPYYNRTAAGRLPNGVPETEEFHDFVVEVLKAMRTYHRSYRAAFRHPKRDRLPLIPVPVVLACSSSDMLAGYADELRRLVPGAALAELPAWGTPDYAAQAVARMIGALESLPAKSPVVTA